MSVGSRQKETVRDERDVAAAQEALHVVFVLGWAFPFGSAYAQRVHAYGRALVEQGHRVTVLCIRAVLPPDASGRKVPTEGVVDGIEYRWTPGQAERESGFLARRLLELKGAAGGVAHIARSKRDRGVDAIVTYVVPAWVDLLYRAAAVVERLPVVAEKNEYPFPDRSHLSNRVKAFAEEAVSRLCYDGIIVISRNLEEYFGRVAARHARLLRVPILVDFHRFVPVVRDRTTGEVRIAYCGDPYGNKDGVPILLEAFARVSAEFPEARLWVIGDSFVPGVLDGLRAKAAGLGIGEQVVFTGRVSAEEVPRLIGEADVLALARPTGLQAQGGFPTKLGEYLATGNPVVVTRVGELSEWLEDGREVFFCEPDSVDAFAARLRDVLRLPDRGREVGRRGREKALACFDYRVHAAPLAEFIKSLRKGGRS